MTRDDMDWYTIPTEVHGDDGCPSVCGHGFRCEDTELHEGNHTRGTCMWNDEGHMWTDHEGDK